MKTKKYNKGGKAALYDMVKKYLEGGMMKYENGGVHKDEKSDVQVIAKESYSTAEEPRSGLDYIIMVDGSPTDIRLEEMPNFFKAEGFSDLPEQMKELYAKLPKRKNPEFVDSQIQKVMADMRSVKEDRMNDLETIDGSRFAKEDLGNMLRVAQSGTSASKAFDVSGLRDGPGYRPKNTQPKGLDTNAFLKGLGNMPRR